MDPQPVTKLALAESALNLYSQIAPLEAQLDPIKQELRVRAPGEHVIVPGKGMVVVKRASLGKTTDILVVDEVMFAALDEKLRTMLQLKGVIRAERKITSPRSGAVEIKPNV